ncbi:MAG: hypothetical protein J6C27_00890 [Clostridia bacterium]|nr:hypothetical protein [Clostridia bacterium]
MFTLKNKYGNIIKTVETERQRNNLIDLGYEVVSATTEGTPLTLDEMKLEQLEAYAKEKGIDLTGCKTKPEKLAKIKEFEKESEE